MRLLVLALIVGCSSLDDAKIPRCSELVGCASGEQCIELDQGARCLRPRGEPCVRAHGSSDCGPDQSCIRYGTEYRCRTRCDDRPCDGYCEDIGISVPICM